MHGRVICDQGHLVSQCKCINHNEDTVIAHKEGCTGPVVKEPPKFDRYKPFYAVELRSVAQQALAKAKDDESTAEEIMVKAMQRLEVNTRVQLLNHLFRAAETGHDLTAVVHEAYKQALDEYHSHNFWSGNTGKVDREEPTTLQA